MGELTWRERGRLWLRLGLRLVLTIVAVWLVWTIGRPVLRLLMPFVVALVLTWILNPAIHALEKQLKVSRRPISMIMVILGLAVVGAAVAGLLYALASQILSFLTDWESIWDTVMSGVTAVGDALEEPLSRLPEAASAKLYGLEDHMVAWLGEVVPDVLSAAAGRAGSVAMSLPTWVVSVIVCVMATYFISADYPTLRSKAVGCIPQEFRGFFSYFRRVSKDAFGGYVKAEVILSLWVTLLMVVGFWITREPYGLLLAVIFGVLDFIPIIGAGTVMVPWAVIDIAMGNYSHAIGLMIIWGCIVLLRRVAEPKIVGSQTGLPPVASLISIYVGMRLGGVLGMVLGPVVFLIVWNIARAGYFDNTLRDLRLAMGDISALLKNTPELPEDKDEE